MRSFFAFLILGIMLISSAAVVAAPMVTINVPAEGDYSCWFVYSSMTVNTAVTFEINTSTPRKFSGKTATVNMPLVKDKLPMRMTLFVLNVKNGNEAIVPLDEKMLGPLKPGESPQIDLTADKFKYIRRVEVQVESDKNDQPVAGGLVKLESAREMIFLPQGSPDTQILDPSSRGTAVFHDVLAGQAKLVVKTGENTVTQEIKLPLERESAVHTVRVPVVGDVETVQIAQEQTPAGTPSAGAPSGGKDKGGFSLLTFLIGMALLVGIVYGAYAVLKSRGTTVRNALQQMGVDLPQDAQASAGAQPSPIAVDPGTCPFCGGKKDPATGACACSLTSGAPASSSVGGGPRLIGTQGAYSGNIYTIDGLEATLGRDESNEIAFPQDNTASRKHARIVSSNGQWVIRDEGSSNGTFVNGVKVTEQALHPGDEIQVGSTRLRFEA